MNAADVAAHNLRVDHVTAEVLRAFEAAGVASVLLKGPSTVRWLYAGRPHRYHDCDLLVAPAAIPTAERVLHGLGFEPALQQRQMPAWWREHAIEWLHPQRFAAVDLHHTLKGIGVDDTRLWEVLHAETETMIVGGYPSTVLTLSGRALLLAVDVAGNGYDQGHRLDRAVELAGDGTWEKATQLARELEATVAFATGLRLVGQGRALAARLELPRERSIDATLRATLAPRQALTVDRFARASGLVERAGIARHKLLPPPTFMRHWWPRARGGRGALLLAYGRRIVWVARKAPRALRAWLRARRDTQEEPPTGT